MLLVSSTDIKQDTVNELASSNAFLNDIKARNKLRTFVNRHPDHPRPIESLLEVLDDISKQSFSYHIYLLFDFSLFITVIIIIIIIY